MQTQNIFNLTELWKLGGLLSGKLISEKEVYASLAGTGSWPNKLWIDGQLTAEKLKTVSSIGKGKQLSFALWEEKVNEKLLTENGFQFESELIGMSRYLSDFSVSGNLEVILKKVNTSVEAAIWSKVFFDAFGYEIQPPTLLSLKEKVEFFLAWCKEKPIGTSMTFRDSHGISGIYSIGVVPAFRGKGLANQLFETTLSELNKTGSRTVILQASALGLGLYLNHGFQPDFKIKFYKKIKK